MTPLEISIVAIIGLAAGSIGGLAGIGGSLIMLPALVLLLGSPTPTSYHVYMAAAMIVNVAVSLPAALRHHKARAVRLDIVRVILPVMAVTIVAGVLLSNRDSNAYLLRLLLALFIATYCLINLARFFRKAPEPEPHHQRVRAGRLAAIGAGTGLIAGLLGIGGGIVMVPMLQVFTRIPIRQAIGTSSAIMVLTACVGAALKISTLGNVGHAPHEALAFAAAMAPGAVLGAWIGARLTHALPLQAVRVVISLLLLVAAAKLAQGAIESMLEDRTQPMHGPDQPILDAP
jgi:uncharacterized membrane protein YfcA